MKSPVEVSKGLTVPLSGGFPIRRTSVSPSTSEHVTVPSTGEFTAVVSGRSWHTGASLTEVTVIDIVAALESRSPSLARNVKLSEPWKSASGL